MNSMTDSGVTPLFQQPVARIVMAVLVFLIVGTARYYRAQHRAERFASHTPVEQQAAPAPVAAEPAVPVPVAPVEAVAEPMQPVANRAFGSTRAAPSPTPTVRYGYQNTSPTYAPLTPPRNPNPHSRSQQIPFRQVGHTNLNDPQRLREMATEVEAFNAANRARREQNAALPSQPEPFAPPAAPVEPATQEPSAQGYAAPDQAPPVPPATGNNGELPRF